MYFTNIINKFDQFTLIPIFAWKSKTKQMYPVTARPYPTIYTNGLIPIIHINAITKAAGQTSAPSVCLCFSQGGLGAKLNGSWCGSWCLCCFSSHFCMTRNSLFFLYTSSSVVVNFMTNRLFLHVGLNWTAISSLMLVLCWCILVLNPCL